MTHRSSDPSRFFVFETCSDDTVIISCYNPYGCYGLGQYTAVVISVSDIITAHRDSGCCAEFFALLEERGHRYLQDADTVDFFVCKEAIEKRAYIMSGNLDKERSVFALFHTAERLQKSITR